MHFECYYVDDAAKEKVQNMQPFDALVVTHDVQFDEERHKTALRAQIHLNGKLVMQSPWKRTGHG